jgi:hypothetical protein
VGGYGGMSGIVVSWFLLPEFRGVEGRNSLPVLWIVKIKSDIFQDNYLIFIDANEYERKIIVKIDTNIETGDVHAFNLLRIRDLDEI